MGSYLVLRIGFDTKNHLFLRKFIFSLIFALNCIKLKMEIKLKFNASSALGGSNTEQLKGRITAISSLTDNWDGYGAIRPNSETIHQANVFLSQLNLTTLQYLNSDDISPTPYGTIVMDFYRSSNRLSVEVGESKIGFFSDFVNNQYVESDGVNYDQTKLPNELQTAIELFDH
jgi:hypothetical protein